jgi:large subunit ribosomal protein L5
LQKVVLNVGVGKGLKDEKYTDAVESTLSRITGQKPVKTKSKKSIAAFKIREGNTVGLKVTLRGRRMYDFIEKLVNVSLPRVRDFQGLKINSFDGQGNYTLGIKEHIIFPEIKADEVENLHGLEIVIVTTANSDELAKKLLIALHFPFNKK